LFPFKIIPTTTSTSQTGYVNLDCTGGETTENQLWSLGKNLITDGKGFITCGTDFENDPVALLFALEVEQSLPKGNV